ncbi:MobH family relaxase [Winslowiella toletana]|nr:MobH family relaxase [Winslowiella toletana]
MLKWLRRKTAPAPDAELSDGWFKPASAEKLLTTPQRQRLLNQLWQCTAVPRTLFDQLYLTPVNRLAELVQLFPASENHHHSAPGGMLDHCLEVACFAARLRQNYLLPPSAPAEEQSRQTEVWTAAVIYAALLHDVGKVAVDITVELIDGSNWHPWLGPVRQPWRLRYPAQDKDYRLHPAAGALLCTQILPPQALSWLTDYREAFTALVYCISGHYEYAGVLGELVQKADRASVAQNLGGDAVKAFRQPVTSFAQQMVGALRYLVQNEFKLSNPDSGSDGWLTEDALWLISKTTADRIRAYLLGVGITGVPDSNIRLFDEMLAHKIAVPNGDKVIWSCTVASESGWEAGVPLTLLQIPPALIWETGQQRPAIFSGSVEPVVNKQQVESVPEPAEQQKNAKNLSCADRSGFSVGEHFINWLKTGIGSGHLPVNAPAALLHIVENQLFLVSPGIFKHYVKETSGTTGDEWKQVQKDFQKLQLHRRGHDGVNIWTCEVKGPRGGSKITGYLLINSSPVLGNQVLSNNPWLRLKVSISPESY